MALKKKFLRGKIVFRKHVLVIHENSWFDLFCYPSDNFIHLFLLILRMCSNFKNFGPFSWVPVFALWGFWPFFSVRSTVFFFFLLIIKQCEGVTGCFSLICLTCISVHFWLHLLRVYGVPQGSILEPIVFTC